MAELVTYSTADVQPFEKIDYWEQTLSDTFTGKTVEVGDAGRFRGRFDVYCGRDVSFANVIHGQSVVRHGLGQARSSQPSVNVHLQVFGESINVQDDKVARLRTGHYTICDSELPFAVHSEHEMGLFVLRMDKSKFLEICPRIGDARCRQYDGTAGTGKIFTTFIHSLWRELALGMGGGQADEMTDLAINLLGATLRQPTDTSVISANFHAKDRDMRQFIERNIGERDLSPATIADAFNISTRYVHKIFSATKFTVNGYIRHRRLESARMMLVDPDHHHLSITEIALIWGFSDSSQFASAFRAEYEVTPRDYRKGTMVPTTRQFHQRVA